MLKIFLILDITSLKEDDLLTSKFDPQPNILSKVVSFQVLLQVEKFGGKFFHPEKISLTLTWPYYMTTYLYVKFALFLFLMSKVWGPIRKDQG